MITGRQYAEEALKIFRMTPKAGYIWGTKGVLWTKARQDNLNKTTDSDRAMGRKYGKKWIGHYVWDCSGLTSYCGDKLGLKFHHGSNSSWRYDCEKKGNLTKNMDLPVGAWVYTGTSSSKPHIGIYTGDGMVTEAAGTQQGVIQTKLHGGKWKFWGLGKGITFTITDAQEPAPEPVQETPQEPAPTQSQTQIVVYPTIRRGARGELVVQLQRLLAKDGSSLEIDGIFGPGTQSAVKAFQKRHKLEVDGIVGPKTWKELVKLI